MKEIMESETHYNNMNNTSQNRWYKRGTVAKSFSVREIGDTELDVQIYQIIIEDLGNTQNNGSEFLSLHGLTFLDIKNRLSLRYGSRLISNLFICNRNH